MFLNNLFEGLVSEEVNTRKEVERIEKTYFGKKAENTYASHMKAVLKLTSRHLAYVEESFNIQEVEKSNEEKLEIEEEQVEEVEVKKEEEEKVEEVDEEEVEVLPEPYEQNTEVVIEAEYTEVDLDNNPDSDVELVFETLHTETFVFDENGEIIAELSDGEQTEEDRIFDFIESLDGEANKETKQKSKNKNNKNNKKNKSKKQK